MPAMAPQIDFIIIRKELLFYMTLCTFSSPGLDFLNCKSVYVVPIDFKCLLA